MKRLREYQLDSFYGVAVKENCVPGLTCQVRHGTRKGEPYSYLVFLQDGRIKWEIIPKGLCRFQRRAPY